MSVADLKQYGLMIAEQEEVRQHAKEIGIEHLDGQIAYAKELGLEFSLEDMQALAEEAGVTGDELSEEQLEQIAGGAITLSAGVAAIALVAGVGLGVLGTVAVVGLGAGVAAAVSKAW